MLSEIKICVIGGDKRQEKLALLLKNYGYDVITTCNSLNEDIKDEVMIYADIANAVYSSNVIVLPIPVTTNGSELNAPYSKVKINAIDILDMVTKDKLILGGKVPENMMLKAKEIDVKVIDYMKREELAVKNAIPTAEGAIQIAMEKLPITIHNSNVLVAGYGRVGKILSEKLYALGAHVTVSARKHEDFAWIYEKGYNSINTKNIKSCVGDFDLIYNTVPALVFNRDVLKKMNKYTLLVDLASKPGGVDYQVATELGLEAIPALSLPGKMSPETAAKIIKETLITIMEEVL